MKMFENNGPNFTKIALLDAGVRGGVINLMGNDFENREQAIEFLTKLEGLLNLINNLVKKHSICLLKYKEVIFSQKYREEKKYIRNFQMTSQKGYDKIESGVKIKDLDKEYGVSIFKYISENSLLKHIKINNIMGLSASEVCDNLTKIIDELESRINKNFIKKIFSDVKDSVETVF